MYREMLHVHDLAVELLSRRLGISKARSSLIIDNVNTGYAEALHSNELIEAARTALREAEFVINVRVNEKSCQIAADNNNVTFVYAALVISKASGSFFDINLPRNEQYITIYNDYFDAENVRKNREMKAERTRNISIPVFLFIATIILVVMFLISKM